MSGFIVIPEIITGSGSAPIGPASGELSGSYPNPNVVAINGASVPDSGSVPVGNVLQISATDTLIYGPINLAGGSEFVSGVLPIINQAAQALGGDLSGTTTSSTVIKVHGATVPIAGSLTVGNLLQVSGAGALSYGPLNIAGGSNYISGLLPVTNQAAQNLSGDLSGTTASAAVIKINGTSVPTAPSANQVLIASSGTSSVWSQINDSNIVSGANIAASKLAYSDLVTPVLGSTTVQGAIDAIKTSTVATVIQRQSQNITLANLQGIGALATATFNVGSSLPANARVLGAEINIVQALAGLGLATAITTIQSSTDSVGSLVAGASVLTTGFIGSNGINQYLSRGGSQITAIVTLTGALFSGLTAGSLTVNVFYAVIL